MLSKRLCGAADGAAVGSAVGSGVGWVGRAVADGSVADGSVADGSVADGLRSIVVVTALSGDSATAARPQAPKSGAANIVSRAKANRLRFIWFCSGTAL
jgi:hypothetical protein